MRKWDMLSCKPVIPDYVQGRKKRRTRKQEENRKQKNKLAVINWKEKRGAGGGRAGYRGIPNPEIITTAGQKKTKTEHKSPSQQRRK